MAGTSTSAGAQGTQDRVEAARAAVDDVAQRWFDAQADAAEIEERIAAVAQRVAVAEDKAALTRQIATARALQIYQGAGTSFTTVLDSGDALDSARRVELIDRVNSRSNAAIDNLDRVAEDLRAERAELETARKQQDETLARLEAERAELEQALDEAVDAHSAEEARRAEEEAARATAQAASGAARASGASPLAAGPGPATSSPTADSAAAPESSPEAGATPAPLPPVAGEHPRHNEPFLACTRGRESGGNYAAVNPAGYYGAYQFSPLTWDTTASHAGRAELIGVLPSQASAYDQDDLAWSLYQWQGNAPWGGRC